MNYTDIATFNCYINNYEDDASTTAVKTMILDSAESVVDEYLGYDPISSEEVEYHICQGHSKLFPDRRNITLISEVLQNGVDITEDCTIRNDALYSDAFIKGAHIKLTYTSGWASSSAVPAVIKETVYRVAALMYAETGGAIGLSSRTSPDGSKTYVSYNNYAKYLAPLDKYRRIRL